MSLATGLKIPGNAHLSEGEDAELVFNGVVLFAFILVLALPFAYQAAGAWWDRRRYPQPGRIVNGLHVLESGTTGPSVVLESGIAGSSLSWKPVLDRTAGFARVLAYDRAGLGWSRPADSPRTVDNIVRELRTLLITARVPAPYILVGHSFGGLIVNYFAARYPGDVAGLVLVDPVPLADWFPLTASQKVRLGRGVSLSRRGAWLARFGVVRLALACLMSGSRQLPRFVARASAGRGASVAERLTAEVGKLPPQVWPMVRAHWCLPKCFSAMADYLEALPENAARAAAAQLVTNVPVALISAHGTCPTVPDGCLHVVAERSGHWIQLDQPELVSEAIRNLITSNARL